MIVGPPSRGRLQQQPQCHDVADHRFAERHGQDHLYRHQQALRDRTPHYHLYRPPGRVGCFRGRRPRVDLHLAAGTGQQTDRPASAGKRAVPGQRLLRHPDRQPRGEPPERSERSGARRCSHLHLQADPIEHLARPGLGDVSRRGRRRHHRRSHRRPADKQTGHHHGRRTWLLGVIVCGAVIFWLFTIYAGFHSAVAVTVVVVGSLRVLSVHLG
jgi:hypothetical protein